MDCLRRRLRGSLLLSDSLDNTNTRRRSNHPRYYLLQEIRGDMYMKVVLIKSPKLLAPILRAVFKVKKITYEN